MRRADVVRLWTGPKGIPYQLEIDTNPPRLAPGSGATTWLLTFYDMAVSRTAVWTAEVPEDFNLSGASDAELERLLGN